MLWQFFRKFLFAPTFGTFRQIYQHFFGHFAVKLEDIFAVVPDERFHCISVSVVAVAPQIALVPVYVNLLELSVFHVGIMSRKHSFCFLIEGNSRIVLAINVNALEPLLALIAGSLKKLIILGQLLQIIALFDNARSGIVACRKQVDNAVVYRARKARNPENANRARYHRQKYENYDNQHIPFKRDFSLYNAVSRGNLFALGIQDFLHFPAVTKGKAVLRRIIKFGKFLLVNLVENLRQSIFIHRNSPPFQAVF